ncbi:MAG TPA: aminoglycoside phosphotransferase family protein [Burkholderiales bacterium]|nr:aminoglycoside phosphotransferase family protein [Burkholderiales bacterium]
MNDRASTSVDDAFAPFCDAQAMQPLLQEAACHLWGEALNVVESEVAHAWRKIYVKPASAHKSFMQLCYRATLARRGSSPFIGWMHGSATPHASPSRRGPRQYIVPVNGIWLALHRFPDDEVLPQLPQLSDLPRIRPTLAALTRGRIADADIEVVSYRPGERCTLRFALHEESSGRERVLFAKTFRDDRGQVIFDRMLQLWAQGITRGAGAYVPLPIEYDGDTRTLWQHGVPGPRALASIDDTGFAHVLHAAMRTLGLLHTSKLEALPWADRASLLADTRKRAAKLALVHTELASPLEGALATCERALDVLPRFRPVPIHGDAHLGQFLIADGQAVMVDLDELAMGDVEQDLAGLIVDVLCHRSVSEEAEGWMQSALDAYAVHRGASHCSALLEWHLCMQFINKAYRIFWKGAVRHDLRVAQAVQRALDAAQLLHNRLEFPC